MMDKIKRVILFNIPMSICNLRCHYCYLAQRDECYQGKQIEYKYSPEYVAQALSVERLGGVCYINLCAEGETLLTKDIDKYIYALAKEGHYLEIVTNLTVSKMLHKILSFDQEILNHITFKCSFHYLQLKEKNLLTVFASNVNSIWEHNCSANIEITPDDELIPFIEEVKKFSLRHFGALPHLSIARNDGDGHGYLTSLSLEEYDKVWSQFDSSFWRFKRSVFGEKRTETCYAGDWALTVDFQTGDTRQCYCSRYNQNIFKDINKAIDFVAINKCMETHCYNGHALLTLGCIPGFTDVKYGDIRNRTTIGGKQWIQPQMLNFLNSKLEESNDLLSEDELKRQKWKMQVFHIKEILNNIVKKYQK